MTQAGRDPRHGGLHVARAGARDGRRPARRHLGVRRRAVRDAHRAGARSPARTSPRRSRTSSSKSRRGTRCRRRRPRVCARRCALCLQKDPSSAFARHRRLSASRSKAHSRRPRRNRPRRRPRRRAAGCPGWPPSSSPWRSSRRWRRPRYAICAKRRRPFRLRCASRSRRPPPTRRWSSRCRPTAAPWSLSRQAMGRRRLWLRPLDQTEARPLAGTEGATDPFWSPDSRSIGFFAAGKLRRLDVAGGAPQVLATRDGKQPRRQLERGRHDSVPQVAAPCGASRPPGASR